MSVLTGLIGIVIGVLLASWLARWQAVAGDRVRHTLNLVDEFHSREMLKARFLAFGALTSVPKNSPISLEQCRAKGEEAWIAISVMLHYFDKVEALLETRRIEYKLLERLLGHYVRDWRRYLGPDHLLLDTIGQSDWSGQSDWPGLQLSVEQLGNRFAKLVHRAFGASPRRATGVASSLGLR